MIAGASIGCGGSLSGNPGSAGTGGATSSSGRGGRTGSAGTSGIAGTSGTGGGGGDAGTGGGGGDAGAAGGGFGGFGGEIDCPSTATKGTVCTPSDLQRCNRTCGPDQVGAKTEVCSTAGVYDESGCIFDPNRNYSCYSIPGVANTICPTGPLQAATACGVPGCTLCNSSQGLPGGQYVDSAGAPKIGYCVCQAPDLFGLRTWSCVSDTQWPCPANAGCARTGTGGVSGGSGTGGAAGTGGVAFGQPACPSTVTKGAACAPTDVPFCYKTCGPEKTGVKSESCAGGVYAEMSGCSFDPSRDYSCYRLPGAANPICPVAVPQASAECDVPACTTCNSSQGVPGGQYLDASGAVKVGYCVCQAPNASGLRVWSCASDTQWPCPVGPGCTATGIGGSTGTGGVTGTGGGAGGAAGAGGASFGQPACPATVTKGGACASTDVPFCYKTCGPDKTGVKTDTCTGGVYSEMSGCTFDPTRDYSCYKLPSMSVAACGTGTPLAGSPCDVAACQICNSIEGLPGGGYLDSTGAAKVGYCVCQAPNSAGARTWSCASDTAWPCPAGAGC